MTLQAQKLNIIESLIQLNDKKILSEIETFLKNNMKASSIENNKSLTKRELISRAKKSNKNIASGKVMSQSKLEKASELW